jgi:hypothetical protein
VDQADNQCGGCASSCRGIRATDDNDVTVLFLTNKPLDIHYLSAEESPSS